MGKFNFIQAGGIRGIPDAGNITEKCCLETLELFRENAMLAMATTTMPAFVFWTAMEWVKAGTRAKNQILGYDASDAQIAPAAQAIGQLFERYMAEAMNLNRDEQVTHLIEKTTMFEKFCTDAGPNAEAVLTNLLKTIVVQSCTVIEVLMEDLYRATKMAFPKNFAHIGPKSWVSFRSRRGFRHTYATAFSHDAGDIDAAITDKSIDALSLLRNVIVHKASLADQDFRDGVNVTPLLAPFISLQNNDPVELDGEIVRSIVDPAFKAGYQLVVALDL